VGAGEEEEEVGSKEEEWGLVLVNEGMWGINVEGSNTEGEETGGGVAVEYRGWQTIGVGLR